MTPRPRALVTAPLRGPGFAQLRRLADVVYDPWIDQRPLRIYSAEQLADRITAVAADVLVVESDSVGGPVFERGLRVVAATRGDPSNVDIPGATAAGIPPDCLLDSLLLEDPGLLADDLQVPGGTSAAIPSASSTPSLPNLGGATMPGGGATPALVPGVSAPGGLPLSGLLRGVGDEPELTDFDERGQEVRDPADYEHSNEPDERRADDREGADEDAGLGKSESPPQAPTTVTLPNGETVTAASPQLAAAIKAAASGTPIADAFQQQGIAIPLPGTAVANPVDPARISAGDVGVFTATPLPLALAKLFWTARFNTSQPCEGQTF